MCVITKPTVMDKSIGLPHGMGIGYFETNIFHYEKDKQRGGVEISCR